MRSAARRWTRGTPWRRAKSSAFAKSRRMTASSADPLAFWNPGPLLISATSPQPIIPQRTESIAATLLVLLSNHQHDDVVRCERAAVGRTVRRSDEVHRAARLHVLPDGL